MAEFSSLGRYQLRRVLGSGAMGVVYEGFDPALSRQVAVKTILKSVALDAETERTYAARFTLEAKAVARLNHPNIVQVYDFGVEGEVAYLVMEFIAGQELRAAFDAGEKFEVAEVVRIMGELLDALDFAHERGVIHRDVKPANVMLDAQRRVKLADFGVARLQEGERATVGTMVGTPAFMSPEQIKGQKIDRRTDVFSAGTILYQLLTGEQPFKGDGVWTVAKKIIEEDPPAPSAVILSVSPAFDDVVYQAMSKEPSERFARASEFAAALRAAGAGSALPGVARPSAPKPRTKPEIKASETELEFWRSIQNRDDLDELELFLEQFPEGAYAQLARLKVAKLRAPLEAARAAETKARQEAEEQARRQAEEQARREAEARAKREAEEKAKREAEDRAKREAEEKAKREALERARREAEQKARDAAIEKAKRDAAEKLRQAQVAAAAIKPRSTEPIDAGRAATVSSTPAARKSSYALPISGVVIAFVAGIGVYLFLGRTPPAPVAEAPATLGIDKAKKEGEERVRRELADKAAAEKATAELAAARTAAAERAAAEKAMAERAVAEAAVAKAAAEKGAAPKTAAERVAAEKAAAEKLAAERAAAEKAATEKLAAERAVAEKLAQEKAAADRAAEEKLAAERAAAEKAAPEKLAVEKAALARAKPAAPAPAGSSGWPKVGDWWTYRMQDHRDTHIRRQDIVEVRSVTESGIVAVARRGIVEQAEWTHRPGAYVVGSVPGGIVFAPHIGAFRTLKQGDRWDNISHRRVPFCAADTSCRFSAVVRGTEQVAVEAGTFQAFRIELELRWQSQREGQGTRLYTLWYADAVKRMVKLVARDGSGRASFEPDTDVELIAFELH